MKHFYVSTPRATGLVTVDERRGVPNIVVGTPPIWRKQIGKDYAEFLRYVHADKTEELVDVERTKGAAQ